MEKEPEQNNANAEREQKREQDNQNAEREQESAEDNQNKKEQMWEARMRHGWKKKGALGVVHKTSLQLGEMSLIT